MSGVRTLPGYQRGNHGRPSPIVQRDRLSIGARLERFLRVAPSTTLTLLAIGLVLSLLAAVTEVLRTPFGYSSFPVWIIFAINGGMALGGSGMLILSSKSAG